MKKYLLILLLFPSLVFSQSFSLKQSFENLPEKAFLITKQKNIYTLLHLLKKDKTYLYFEELTISDSSFEKLQLSWREWVHLKAPQHTQWFRYAWNRTSGEVDKLFSVSENRSISPNSMNQFFPTLMDLKLQKVPENKRKKRGGSDYWTPKTIWDGKILLFTNYDEWSGSWPNDKSELSGITLRTYIPKDTSIVPLRIPYWISFESNTLYQIIKTVDAGLDLESSIDFSEVQFTLKENS